MIFRIIIELRNEKLTYISLEFIKVLIYKGFFIGAGEDVFSGSEFDEKAKKLIFKNILEEKKPTVIFSLLELLLNLAQDIKMEKKDKIKLISFKLLYCILIERLFFLSADDLLKILTIIYYFNTNLKNSSIKRFSNDLLVLLFKICLQRFQCYSLFDNLTNFYSYSTKKYINEECKSVINYLVNVVVLKNQKIYEYIKEHNHSVPIRSDLLEVENFVFHNKYFGIFGFCYVCDLAADLYCKETRLPLCSYGCKLKIFEKDRQIISLIKQDKKLIYNEKKFSIRLILLFEKLFEYCFNSVTDGSLYLEVFYKVFDSTFESFNFLKNSYHFIKFIKDKLFPKLVETLLYSEDSSMKFSFFILNFLLKNLTKNLRAEISGFLEEVIFPLLNNPNSSYAIKSYSVEFLGNIIKDRILLLELFLNFDLKENYSSICQRIIDFLIKISIGKYEETYYAGIISTVEEERLRISARQALMDLVNNAAVLLESHFSSNAEYLQKLLNILCKKKEIEEAISLCNSGKMKGFSNLRKLNVLGENPSDLVEFIISDKRISPAAVGEIFGQEDDFSQETLNLFLDKIDYKDVDILKALKLFLEKFELPSEAQKVERILEKFAIKFSRDNSKLLTSDTAHLLSFSFMMLQTNIHNPQVIEKMNLGKYISICKNIEGAEQFLSIDRITAYYNSLVSQPIAIHFSEKRRKETQENLQRTLKEKYELYKVQSQILFKAYKKRVNVFNIEKEYLNSIHSDIFHVFLKNSWANFHSFFSNNIAKTIQFDHLHSLLTSNFTMVRLCDLFNLETERNSFINIIVQFSGLENTLNNQLSDINIIFIHSIIELADKLGGSLHSGWKTILECLFVINYYHSFAQKNSLRMLHGSPTNVEDKNSLFISNHFSPDVINQIYIKTKYLDYVSICDFFSAFCELCLKEIEKNSSRVFYILEQIVIIFHYNIQREIFHWIGIWDIMKLFFNEIINKTSKTTTEIIYFSIDIIKQLVICCFSNNELILQNHQNRILDIYFTISSNTHISLYMTEFILLSMYNAIKRDENNINSGINSIVQVLIKCILCIKNSSSSQNNRKREISALILNIIEFILDKIEIYYHHILKNIILIFDIFVFLCDHSSTETIQKVMQHIETFFFLFWDQKALAKEYQISLLQAFFYYSSQKLEFQFQNEDIFFVS